MSKVVLISPVLIVMGSRKLLNHFCCRLYISYDPKYFFESRAFHDSILHSFSDDHFRPSLDTRFYSESGWACFGASAKFE